MKILHMVNHCRNVGNGIVNVCVDLACKQSEHGHEVAVVSSGGEFVELLQEYGVRHYTVRGLRDVRAVPRSLLQLHKAIDDFQPDIVHAHTVAPALMARALSTFSRYALVTTVHNEFQRHATLMGVGKRVIAVSKAVADSLVRRGIPEQKVRVVLNGPLGSPRRQSVARLVTEDDIWSPRIVTVAGMYERKGIRELIMAFFRISGDHPEVHLYLVGDGPDREKFENLAHRAATPDRIHFVGFVPDPEAYMDGSTVFVLASREESFALVIPEARALGLPIVATNVGGIPEVLDGGQAGLLVEPMNVDALEAGIRRVLDSRELREELSSRALAGLDRFQVERMCRETLEVYLEATTSEEVESA
ncbi:glycosyltransferase family 4 protein [Alicyclobacillus fructus]|uniref:glycosyltransferase family 4 protein n=1 Tax=Alicyclobacillus fructus TaxID=2816082 RepID=UPI001A8C9434|nr:glycosyltransferase family 4 protein [Alicyclobacillus fructus]